MTRLRASEERPPRPDGVAEGSVVTVLRVPPEMAGMRLDLFVVRQLKRTSRTRAQAIVKASAYGLDGKRLRPNDRVTAEQRVMLWRPPWDETPVPTQLPVLFEDAHLLVLDKPAGVPVHPTARYHKNTVVKLLEAARPGERFFLGHRLDRETSGVLVLTKTSAADRAVKIAFQDRGLVEKRYVAITWNVPEEARFRLDLPLEWDPTSTTRVKMRVARPGTGLAAATRFEVLAARRRNGRSYALVQCDLETGRQHQIRVHLAAIGCPIVGDKLYAFEEDVFKRDVDGVATDHDRARLEFPRHALHAARLVLPHPSTGAPLVLEAPLAPDMAALWTSLE